MVIDSSALLAILFGESEAQRLVGAIARDGRRLVGAVTMLESAIVIEARNGDDGGRDLDLLAHRSRLHVVGMTSEHGDVARAAWRRFGKGRHPAALNIGDCCSYALARTLGEPLLFKGNDFSKTDVIAAPY